MVNPKMNLYVSILSVKSMSSNSVSFHAGEPATNSHLGRSEAMGTTGGLSCALTRLDPRHTHCVDVPVCVSTREVYSSAWMTVREDVVRWPDGVTDVYPIARKRDFVVVLPRQAGGLWLVEQYRYPVGGRRWEFPQGSWPLGEAGDPLALARNELREETGFSSRRWTPLGRLEVSAGLTPQGFDVFLAEDLREGLPAREGTEADMLTSWRDAEEIRSMIRTGEISDACTIAAYALYLNQVQEDAGRSPPDATLPG